MPSDSDSRPSAPGPEMPHLHEERLRLAIEATGLGTWDLDPLTGALLWDERCKALFGLPPDASLDDDTFFALVHPEDREHVRQAVQRALDPSGSGSYRLDYRIMSPRDGSIRWLSTSGRAFFDSSGRAVRFLGTVLDITGRVLEREAAEREKHRVTTLLENISQAFEAFDRDWRFIYLNREAERLLGSPREELLGRTQWEVYPESVGTPVEHYFRRAASERIPLSFENHYAPWDRWFEVHLYPTDEGIAVLFQDVTVRKRREEERERLLHEQTRLREQAEQALRERQRAVEVLEHGEALVVVDKDFHILLVNEHQERLSRTRREDTLGRSLWEVFPPLARPDANFQRAFRQVLEQQVPVQFEEHYAPLGLWVGMSVYPTSEGGLAVFFRDITERKRAEQFRARLMGIVSHDLRSPLNGIALTTEQLLRREDVTGTVLAGVQRIARSTERMSRMITDLLDFTRARLGGGIPLRLRPCQLVEQVRATLEELEVTHPGRIVLSHAPGSYTGQWDPDRLAQVVSNLVGNALQHGARDTPVEVRLEHEDSTFILSVHNQGPPIPEALLPHVFDPFFRANDQSRQGLGLGLYIVQQLILAHGGSITVDSRVDAGTTFTVRLPHPAPTP
ncbi:PAS domain-containing protein [Archangium violaceum]|uniref:PAS domain-containing sensor histidine kinase n=1 Tax=Archangium violaceum TaxID=83451 RepID=UPI002B2FE2D0|nr:PAS domain-containing protein [Archangium gephyra]